MDRLTSTTSPKTRLNFLLDDSPGTPRLPDRGRAARSLPQPSSTTRALSADGCIGKGHHNTNTNSNNNVSSPLPGPPPPRSLGSLDWNPGRQHSNDSLSSSGSIDIIGSAYRAVHDDSSESGSASGTSPRLRVLPAPSLLPAAHLLQSSVYSGVLNAYSAPPAHHQQQHEQHIQSHNNNNMPQQQQQHSIPPLSHTHPHTHNTQQQAHQLQQPHIPHQHQQYPQSLVSQPALAQLVSSPQAQPTFGGLGPPGMMASRIVPGPLIGSGAITTTATATMPSALTRASTTGNGGIITPTTPNSINTIMGGGGTTNTNMRGGKRASQSGGSIMAAGVGGNGNSNSNSISRTEQQLRERHDQRKMKNRISAAASRDRKKRSFATLQISLQEAESRCQEAQRNIENLKRQLEAARKDSNSNSGENSNNIYIPPDLRHILGGCEYASQQQLLDVLRRFKNHLT